MRGSGAALPLGCGERLCSGRGTRKPEGTRRRFDGPKGWHLAAEFRVRHPGPCGWAGREFRQQAHRRGCTPLNAQGMFLDVDLLDPVAGGPVPATPGGQPTGGNFIPVAHKYVRSVKQMLSVRAAAVLESFRLAPHAADGRLRLAAVSAGRRSRMGRLAGLEGLAHCRSGFRGPESGAQAVDGQAGLGGSQCGLPHCPRGSFGLLHRCRALARLGVIVREEGRRLAPAQVPFGKAGERAQKDMCGD